MTHQVDEQELRRAISKHFVQGAKKPERNHINVYESEFGTEHEYFLEHTNSDCDVEFLTENRTWMYSLTQVGFIYFLPAYMLAVVEGKERSGTIDESLAGYFVDNSEITWDLYSSIQIRVLIDFFTWCHNRDQYCLYPQAMEVLQAVLISRET